MTSLGLYVQIRAETSNTSGCRARNLCFQSFERCQYLRFRSSTSAVSVYLGHLDYLLALVGIAIDSSGSGNLKGSPPAERFLIFVIL